MANFSGPTTLKEMVDHIYGRINVLKNPKRPHMFLREMSLYIERFGQKVHTSPKSLLEDLSKDIHDLEERVSEGISYYQKMAEHFADSTRADFVKALETVRDEMEILRQQIVNSLMPAVALT